MSTNDVPISWLKKCPIGLPLDKKVERRREGVIPEVCLDCAFRDGCNCQTGKAMRPGG